MSGLQLGSILQQIPCYDNETARNYEIEVMDENNQTKMLKLDDTFSYAVLQSPIKFFKPKNFTLKNNGSILIGEHLKSHRQYCLRTSFNKTTNKIDLSTFVYFEKKDDIPAKYVLSATCMVISVIFILATILVYTLLPELHNMHGSCLVCHLAGLVVAYSLTAWVKLGGFQHVHATVCIFRGQLMYFSLLSAFLWSNVISYDLWRNFRATHMFRQFSDKNRFRFYMLYAWGISLLFTFIILIFDYTKPSANSLLPFVDRRTCFLQSGSLLLYFYGPMLIIFTVNIIFFVCTTLKIYQIQRDLFKMTSQEESSRHQTNLKNGKDDLMLYVRLFIITGVTWIMESMSFIISPKNNGFIFGIFDIWNALQGLIIFISYIMKRRVIVLIQRRYLDIFGKETAKESFNLNSSMNKSTNLRLSLSSSEKSKYKEIR